PPERNDPDSEAAVVALRTVFTRVSLAVGVEPGGWGHGVRYGLKLIATATNPESELSHRAAPSSVRQSVTRVAVPRLAAPTSAQSLGLVGVVTGVQSAS